MVMDDHRTPEEILENFEELEKRLGELLKDSEE
jgi:hypothetical protein